MILIRKGRVVDPVTGRDEVLDVLLDGNTICKTGKDLQAGEAEILDGGSRTDGCPCAFPGSGTDL